MKLLCRMKNKLDQTQLLDIYTCNSIIQPHIDYCNTVWGYVANIHLKKIQRLRNRAAWDLTNIYVWTIFGHSLDRSQLFPMNPNLENKILSDDINKPNISPETPTEIQFIELLKVFYPIRMSFVHLFTTILIVLVMQNTIPEKNKIYETYH